MVTVNVLLFGAAIMIVVVASLIVPETRGRSLRAP
jgi:hypothetical protein